MNRLFSFLVLSLVLGGAARATHFTEHMPLYNGITYYNPGNANPQPFVLKFNVNPWDLQGNHYSFSYPILLERGITMRPDTPWVGDSRDFFFSPSNTSGRTNVFMPNTWFVGPMLYGFFSVTGIYTSPSLYPKTALMYIQTNQSWPNPHPEWNGWYYIAYKTTSGTWDIYKDAAHTDGWFYQPGFNYLDWSTYPSFPAALQYPDYGNPPPDGGNNGGDLHDQP